MESSELSGSDWVEVLNGPLRLRCWWAEPDIVVNDIESKSLINRVYIVLPEVFGVNAWVPSVADRQRRPWLSGAGGALVCPNGPGFGVGL